MEQHAILSPSSSHRWLHCTAAPKLEAEEPRKDTDYTLEGTLAHAYCARELKNMIGLDYGEEDQQISKLRDKYGTDEMAEHVLSYVSIVGDKLTEATRKVRDSQLIVERRLDFSKWIPGSFGTADAIIITDGTLEVIDFKYGKGVEVSAEWNSQMMIYALGAVAEFEDEYHILRVRMTIVQPRLSNLSEFELSISELMWWANYVLKPKAEEAMSDNAVQECGTWCRFCSIKGRCAKLAGRCLSIAEEFGDRERVTDDDIAEKILPNLALIKAWVGDMEDYTLSQALSGKHFKGYKLVEGRSIRKVTDPDGLAGTLKEHGFEEIYKPQELKTLTDLERLVGKKDFGALCGSFIDKPKGKPTLVPESDKRPPYDPISSDFDSISNND